MTQVLADVRAGWEDGLAVEVEEEREESGCFLVVLKRKDGVFYCYRYFQLAGEWMCSADLKTKVLARLLAWWREPRAMRYDD